MTNKELEKELNELKEVVKKMNMLLNQFVQTGAIHIHKQPPQQSSIITREKKIILP
jgi:archaellum component FlaC